MVKIFSTTKQPLTVLLAGLAGTVGIGQAASAQIDVTGGGATLENAEIFIPDAARANGDERGVITESTLQDDSLRIQTTQGDLPVTLIYRNSVLPTLETAPGTAPAVGDAGRLRGTVSFRGFNAIGEPALFANIPTTLEFNVSALGPLTNAAFSEYRTGPFQLTEVGTVTSPSSLGVVTRGTPVVLVQYQPAGAVPADQTVLGNDIPGALYTEETPGVNYSTASLDVDFTGGEVLIPTPPGFSETGAATATPTGSDVDTPVTVFISSFTEFLVIDASVDVAVGIVQDTPLLPVIIVTGVFVFENVPSGVWFDPPMADGFEYIMRPREVAIGAPSRVFPGLTATREAEDSRFAAISGFPRGIDADDRFTVSVEGTVLGEFGPGDELSFADYAEQLGDKLVDGGVESFLVSGIDPAVDSEDPTAFPLKLDFTQPTASFEMRARENASVAQQDLSNAVVSSAPEEQP